MRLPPARPVSRREFIGRLSLGTAGLAWAARLRAQPAPERKLGVALLGLGSYATGQLAPALQLTKDCTLAGVVTGSRTKGLAWSRQYGFPEKNIYDYGSIGQLAENREIDIVYVVTPNAVHVANCLAVAQAGKHVICEKPFTTSVADAERVIAACRAARVRLSIGYRLHFDPYHQELMRHGGAKDFGPPLAIKGDRGFFLKEGAWRGERSLAGGGPMMDLGVYIIQGACMAAGGPSADARGNPLPGRLVLPVAVTAQETAKTKPKQFHDVEEGMHWTMEFANGDRCEAFTSYTHSADTFRAGGSSGWIEFREHAFTYRGMVVATNAGPLKFDPPVNQQARQMDDFARCIREGRESRVGGEMGLRDLKILTAIYESARAGRRVELAG